MYARYFWYRDIYNTNWSKYPRLLEVKVIMFSIWGLEKGEWNRFVIHNLKKQYSVNSHQINYTCTYVWDKYLWNKVIKVMKTRKNVTFGCTEPFTNTKDRDSTQRTTRWQRWFKLIQINQTWPRYLFSAVLQ